MKNNLYAGSSILLVPKKILTKRGEILNGFVLKHSCIFAPSKNNDKNSI